MRRSKDTDAHNSSEMAFAIKYNPVRKFIGGGVLTLNGMAQPCSKTSECLYVELRMLAKTRITTLH